MAYPRSDCHYALITDTSFGDENTAGRLGAILTQMIRRIVSTLSHMPTENFRNMSKFMSFLLEMKAAIFGMETFEEHLKGHHFKLFTDHNPLEKMPLSLTSD